MIFCRNVLIYFDEDTKKQVIHSLCDRMEKHAALFLGSSESLLGIETGLAPLKGDDNNNAAGVFVFE